MEKSAIVAALNRFIRQRPGLDPANYISSGFDDAGRRAYLADARSITRDLHHASELLRAVELRSIEADAILRACGSGRLSITQEGVHWCAGQYWPTEYRRGVAQMLASVLWNHWRDNCGCDSVEKIRAEANRSLSRAVVRRFFR